MHETLYMIKEYIPSLYKIDENLSHQESGLSKYNVLDEKNKIIGHLVLTPTGEIHSYFCSVNINKPIKYAYNKQQMIHFTQSFLEKFYENITFKLQSVSEKFNHYELIYEEIDSKYNLALPGTGLRINISYSGYLLRIERGYDTYIINYPDKIIPLESARSRYLESIDFDLKISKPNSDEPYKLCYRLSEKYSYIQASGEEEIHKSIEQQLESLEQFETSSKNLIRILGLNEDYKRIAKKSTLNYRIEIWSQHPKKYLKHLNFNMNEAQPGVIKYKIDKQSDRIIQIRDGEILDENNKEITKHQAYEKALDFLFTMYSNAEELFDFIHSEEIINHVEENKYEPNYSFYFNRVYDSIEIESQIAYVEIGKFTGIVNNFCAPDVHEKELKHINVFAKISEPKARMLYERELEMKLSFIKKQSENEDVSYELVYLPIFPERDKKIQLIDAHNGFFYD